MKAEITQIKLKLSGREILLTADEARAVQKELNSLFEAEKSDLQTIREQIAELERNLPTPIGIPSPYPVPMPIYPSTPPPWWGQQPGTIWCGDNTGTPIGHLTGTGTQTGTLTMSVTA